MTNRESILQNIRKYYISERFQEVDKDFLEFEEEMAEEKDLETIEDYLNQKACGFYDWDGIELANDNNSIILYITDLTKTFDFKLGRNKHHLGTPCDIDLDFQPSGRDKVKEYLIKTYGENQVAQIGAIGTFGMKSIVKDLGRINEPTEPRKSDYESTEEYERAKALYDYDLFKVRNKTNELSKLIPEPVHGKAPNLEKVIKFNLEKKVPVDIEKEYPEFYNFAEYADGMRKQMGVHAAGVVISNFPIDNIIPTWKNDDYNKITQFDKDEVETLGLIKYDLLVIDALDTIAETFKLVKQNYGIELKDEDYYNNSDDKAAYKLLKSGLLAGIFQFETSSVAKGFLQKIAPKDIMRISDINALNRPGPLDSGMADLYIKNLEANTKPEDLPETMVPLLEKTNYCMIYQEQVMQVLSKMAGFSLKEADDARRAIGKKKEKVLLELGDIFIKRCVELKTATETEATKIFKDILKFADYGFNLSHSLTYSFISYMTASLKANYPLEFYTAFLTIKSAELSPDDFQAKLKEVNNECKEFGIEIKPPDINKSQSQFICDPETNFIYYGLAGIKFLAKSSIEEILKSRPKTGFKDIYHFLESVHKGKVNTGKMESLIKAGCFDKLGYSRKELLENIKPLYTYYSDLNDYKERIYEQKKRDKEREEAIANGTKKMPALKLKEEPIKPVIQQHSKITITQSELAEQAELTGVYLGIHPTDMIKGNFISISELWIGETHTIKCIITAIKEITDKNGNKMAFIKLEDKSGDCEATVFGKEWPLFREQAKVNTLIKCKVKVKQEKPTIKCIVNTMEFV